MRWKVPSKPTTREAKLLQRIGRKASFHVFLREIRTQLFDEAFETELERAYARPGGDKAHPPAMLAMVLLLQAYEQVSDAEAVAEAQFNARWQLVLDCLGSDEAPFSQGALSQFRARMVEHDLDKKLLERTVRLAKETGKFGWQRVKYVLDSSPLLGAGRVEDTWNLIGRALSTVVDCASKCLGVPREHILNDAGLSLLSGSSLKAALDIDWDDDTQKRAAFQRLMGEVESLQSWVARNASEEVKKPPLKLALEALARVLKQDLEPDPGGGGLVIRDGVAKNRMPSLGDPEIRHGRKSKSKLFNGFKRHIASAQSLILAATVLPANQPEHEATGPLLDEAEQHGAAAGVLIDRGYLASPRIEQMRNDGKEVLCKPWPTRNRGRFTKEDFVIDLAAGELTCPAGQKALIPESRIAHFPAPSCDACVSRPDCTTAGTGRGRSVTIHAQEALLLELRTLRKTSDGRARLRERVQVEHRLARLSAIQGNRARYKGVRKNELDVRRCAAVANLQVIASAKREVRAA